MNPIKLSANSQTLFNQLVNDYKIGRPAEERVYEPKAATAILYNLANGHYQYSYTMLKEIHYYLKYS